MWLMKIVKEIAIDQTDNKLESDINYVPVVFVGNDNEIEKVSHLVGPETVIIIDDIPKLDRG